MRWTERLVSVSLDRTARVWVVGDVGDRGDVEDGGDAGDMATESSCLLVVAAHSRYITSLALDPAARFFITGESTTLSSDNKHSALCTDKEIPKLADFLHKRITNGKWISLSF